MMTGCNKAACFISVLAVFAFMMAFDHVLHGMVLMDAYTATASLWRAPEEMGQYFAWYAGRNFLLAAVIVCLYKKICGGACMAATCSATEKPKKPCSKGMAVCYGMKVGLILGLQCAGSYAWMPIPMSLTLSWFFGELLKGIGIGFILLLTYKKDGNRENCGEA